MENSKTTTFSIIREFDAPREDVFNAFAEAEALNEWWGPADLKNSVVSLDFRPGGIFHYKMESNGSVSHGRFQFGRIEPHHLLEFTDSFADEDANVIAAPFEMSLPAAVFYSLSFADGNNGTVFTLTGTPVSASEAETEGFQQIVGSMKQEFGKIFNVLDSYLGEVQKK